MIVLKIFGFLLKIIGVLLLIIILLLLAAMCVPLHLEIKYEPDVTFRIRYLFIHYTLAGEPLPQKPPGIIRKALAAAGRWLVMLLVLIRELLSAIFRELKKSFAWIRSRLGIGRKPKKRSRPVPNRTSPQKRKRVFSALCLNSAESWARWNFLPI